MVLQCLVFRQRFTANEEQGVEGRPVEAGRSAEHTHVWFHSLPRLMANEEKNGVGVAGAGRRSRRRGGVGAAARQRGRKSKNPRSESVGRDRGRFCIVTAVQDHCRGRGGLPGMVENPENFGPRAGSGSGRGRSGPVRAGPGRGRARPQKSVSLGPSNVRSREGVSWHAVQPVWHRLGVGLGSLVSKSVRRGDVVVMWSWCRGAVVVTSFFSKRPIRFCRGATVVLLL